MQVDSLIKSLSIVLLLTLLARILTRFGPVRYGIDQREVDIASKSQAPSDP